MNHRFAFFLSASPPVPSVNEPVASVYECYARIQAMLSVACSCEDAAINECRVCLRGENYKE